MSFSERCMISKIGEKKVIDEFGRCWKEKIHYKRE